MFLNRGYLDKKLGLLRAQMNEMGISTELRGWAYATPPVKPARNIPLPVSELAGRYCPTMRDVYLKRVLRVQPPHNFKAFRGIAYHRVISETITECKRFLYERGVVSGSTFYEVMSVKVPFLLERLMDEVKRRIGDVSDEEYKIVYEGAAMLYKYILIDIAYSINQTLSRFPHSEVDSLVGEAIPPITEMKVDGSLIGLSRELSVDLYAPSNAVIDVKTGDVRPFHRYAPTGYALAIEADKGIPIDIGITAYLSIGGTGVPSFSVDAFVISDELRREFLELRDEAQLLVARAVDPGMPSVCPENCPYFSHCHGEE
ncbi:MAG: type I-A CRISPR-associated protein Cas4/Csa1 [Thaumarchaeota archaeon]|nr:type I-A CRISPR-associated protein Cas4/Csa1 [Candidatus Calditenuaceae archaeon]